MAGGACGAEKFRSAVEMPAGQSTNSIQAMTERPNDPDHYRL